MSLDHHTYSPGLYYNTSQVCLERTRVIHRCTWTTTRTGLYYKTSQVCLERTRAIHRCTWTITHTTQGCIILHPRYVWKGPGLYIDVPGPSHIQPRAVLYT